MSNRYLQHRIQYSQADGSPLVGSVGFYLKDTVTPVTTYTTPDRDVANANPLNMESNGVLPGVWFSSADVAAGIKVIVYNGINGTGGTFFTDEIYEESLSEGDSSALWAELQPATAGELAEGITITDYSYPAGNLLRYGVDNAGASDMRTLIQSAIDCGTPKIYAPAGTYLLSELIELGEGQTLCGDGIGQTIFQQTDSSVEIYAENSKLFGISAKSGIAWCRFQDFEIDGNASNNRGWPGARNSTNWNATDHETVEAYGFYFGTQAARTVPERVEIDRVYVRDTVRHGIHWEEGCEVVGGYLKFRNSDVGHALSAVGEGDIATLIIEGHSRQTFALMDSITVNSLTYQNLIANPTAYSNDSMVEFYDNHVQPARVDHVRGNQVDANTVELTKGFDFRGAGDVGSVSFEQAGDATSFALTYADESESVPAYISLESFRWTGAKGGAKLFETPAGNSNPLTNITIRNGEVIGADSSVSTDAFLELASPVDGLSVSDVRVTGQSSGKWLNIPTLTAGEVNAGFNNIKIDECAADTYTVTTVGDIGVITNQQCVFLTSATINATTAAEMKWSRCRFDTRYTEWSGTHLTTSVAVNTCRLFHGLICAPEVIEVTPYNLNAIATMHDHDFSFTSADQWVDLNSTITHPSANQYFYYLHFACTAQWAG